MSKDFLNTIKAIVVLFSVFFIFTKILIPSLGIVFTISMGIISNPLSIYHILLYIGILSTLLSIFLLYKIIKSEGATLIKLIILLFLFFSIFYVSMYLFSKQQKKSYEEKKIARQEQIERDCTKIDRVDYYYYKCGSSISVPDEFNTLFMNDDTDAARYDPIRITPSRSTANIYNISYS